MEIQSLNKQFEESFRQNWDRPALSNYNGITYYYKELARKIEKLHIIYQESGIKPGDKIAICSRNQVNWGVVFLATMTYGAIPVPLLHDFNPTNIHHLVNHSESRVLFVGANIWENIDESQMPNLDAIIRLDDFTLVHCNNIIIKKSIEVLNELFGKKFPSHFGPESLNYYEDSRDDLAIINYTSGTSGFSKGVMIPYRALSSNIMFAVEVEPHMNNMSNVVSMLPSAHMYGLMFEFLFEMAIGAHVHFLTRLPTPKIILEAFSSIKPDLVVSVPLIIEKIYKKKLEPIIGRLGTKLLLNIPVIDLQIHNRINSTLDKTFGNRFSEIIIGGAAFNKEAEAFFKKIGFRYLVGYGMTECAPIIAYVSWSKTKLYSCGKAAPRMQIKIDSVDPENITGQILVKGDNVMLGYYKSEKATAEVFTEDGWMKTGDIGLLDSDGYLFIKGRSKSMILGPSGQNIYPEEIESDINNMPYVLESLVISDKGKLIVLICPDYEQVEKEGILSSELMDKYKESLIILNATFPKYSRVSHIEIFPEEFEKTPKKSIKRYLYQR
ncbi:MAG: AMP-binding protein [Bacteroidales bacterium]